MRKWRDLVVKTGIKRWATGKFGKTINKIMQYRGFSVISGVFYRWKAIKLALRRITKRHNRKSRHASLLKCISIWKNIAIEHLMRKMAHLQEIRVSARALSHVLKRFLRSYLCLFAFNRLKAVYKERNLAEMLSQPLLVLVSVGDKLLCKEYRWAFNSMLRFDREKVVGRQRERVSALARMSVGVVRRAFGEWMELARRMEQHPVVGVIYWMSRVVGKIQQRSMAYALSKIDVVSHALTPTSDDSLVNLGDSHDGPLSSLQHQGSHLDSMCSRSNTLFAPEESAPFMLNKLNESGSKPLELGSVSKDSTQVGSPKPLYRKLPTSKSPYSSSTRPPWRAPSRSGLAHLPSGQAIDRRRAYDTLIKQRQSMSRLRRQSPSAGHSPVNESQSVLEIQHLHFERDMYRAQTLVSPRAQTVHATDLTTLRLKLIVFIRNLQKTYLKRISIGWVAIQHPPPMRYVRLPWKVTMVQPQPVEVCEEEEDDQELETAWRRRLALVASQRLSKAVLRHQLRSSFLRLHPPNLH